MTCFVLSLSVLLVALGTAAMAAWAMRRLHDRPAGEPDWATVQERACELVGTSQDADPGEVLERIEAIERLSKKKKHVPMAYMAGDIGNRRMRAVEEDKNG